jgi:iron complex outermembrane receptor protein
MSFTTKRDEGRQASLALAKQLLFLLPAFLLPLQAQTLSSLRGNVQDAQGGAVAQARVRLFRQDLNLNLVTQTDNAGRFQFERLVPGAVLLEVDKDGFRNMTLPTRLEAKPQTELTLTLEVAGVSQTVLVTATGIPQAFDEIAKATNLLTFEEINLRNEFSLAEALRTLPGMLITNGGGPGQFTNIRIRGMRSDASAVLVDGLRFRDPSATQGDATSFVPALNFVGTDRVEVLRGSASSVYGTNAVGGVVNVITQEGGAPGHGQALFEGGNLGFFRGRLSASGGFQENRFRYSASMMHLNVTRGVDGNDANRSTGGQAFMRYDFTPKVSLSARLWASDNFVQLNVSPTASGIPAANFPATGVIPANVLSPEGVRILNQGGRPDYAGVTLIPGRDDPDSRLSSRFGTTALVFRQTLTPRVNWQTSYQRVHTWRVFQNGPVGTGFQPTAESFSNFIGDIDTVDARFNAVLNPAWSLTGGYEFESERYFDRQNNNLPPPRTVVSQVKARQSSNSAYFASQLGLMDRRLQISFAGRSQFFQLTRPEFQLTGTANNYDRVPLQSPPKALTGDVAISYLIAASSTKVRAHGGNSYRAPALYERFGGGFGANPITGEVLFTPYGDPRLAPDRYNTVDAGVDQYLFQNRIRVSATWFYNRAVSLTAFDSSGGIRPDTDPFGRAFGYINGSGGISRGFELGIEARPRRDLTMTGAYTYTNADLDRDLTVRNFRRVFQVPAHLTSFVVMKQWGRRLDTTLDFFHGGGYFSPFFAVTSARAFQFPGFTKVDLAVGYRVWERETRTARVYTKIDNMLNQRWYQNGWLAPQATFVTGLMMSY